MRRCSFEQLDCLKDLEGLKKLAAGCNKFFIDINGNREVGEVRWGKCGARFCLARQPHLLL